MLDLDFLYKIGCSHEQTTIEHHYHFDIFNEVINFVLIKLNTRFNELSVKLLSLNVVLDPKNSFESFNSDDIYKLAKKFYPKILQIKTLLLLSIS